MNHFQSRKTDTQKEKARIGNHGGYAGSSGRQNAGNRNGISGIPTYPQDRNPEGIDQGLGG
jgi:hypothetical protein